MKKKIMPLFLLTVLPLITAAYQTKQDAPSSKPEKAAYTITRVTGEIDWDRIPALSVSNVLWTEDTGIRAQGQLCYDEENLYVHLSASEKEIRAENTEPLSPVWGDSCLEFFFMPGDSDKYFNFEINPNGCLLIQFGPDRGNRVYLVRKDGAEFFDIRANRTDEGWDVYYRIPLQFIRLFYPDCRFTGVLKANIYKCGDETVNKHYLSWAPIDLASPDFHRPDFFGTMEFE